MPIYVQYVYIQYISTWVHAYTYTYVHAAYCVLAYGEWPEDKDATRTHPYMHCEYIDAHVTPTDIRCSMYDSTTISLVLAYPWPILYITINLVMCVIQFKILQTVVHTYIHKKKEN